MRSTQWLVFVATFVAVVSVNAQERVVAIWPDKAPGSEGVENAEQWVERREVSNIYQPDMTVFLPENRAGSSPAVVVFPGGGYRKIVMEKEGYKVARWLNRNGIAAFVLKYRLDPGEALRDAQRAVSQLRHDAEAYGIDGQRIGVLGFSAGAHLAGNLVVNHAQRERLDAIDDVSSRPDFWVGIYGGYGELFDSVEKADGLPPAFLVHAGDDSRVPVSNSVELYARLHEAGVPAELHVYEHGEHGFALERDRGQAVTSTVTGWSGRLVDWLQTNGLRDQPVYTIENTVNTFDPDKTIETKVGYQYWFADKTLADGKTLKLSVVAPGQGTHAPHEHAEDEFFFVLEGTAEFHLDGKTATGGPMSSFYCPSGSSHGIRNVGDTELKYLVIKQYLLD